MRQIVRFNVFIALTACALALLTAAAALVPALLIAKRVSGTKRTEAARYDAASDGPVLRLHIVANSDSPEDQRIKLAVRDALLSLEGRSAELLSAGDAEAAEALIRRHGAFVLDAVRAELQKQGADYGAQLLLGDFDFPDREYGGVLYPAGRYRALRILLGEAGGENWWCILFPPLCVIRTAPTPGPEPGCTPSEAVRQPAFESLFLRLFRLITKGKTE